jgi:hypothetical protein
MDLVCTLDKHGLVIWVGGLPFESVGHYRVKYRVSKSKLFYQSFAGGGGGVILAFESTHLLFNLQIWLCSPIQSWREVLYLKVDKLLPSKWLPSSTNS